MFQTWLAGAANGFLSYRQAKGRPRPRTDGARSSSPSSESRDSNVTMPIDGRFGIAYAWSVEPSARPSDAYALDANAPREIGRFAGSERVRWRPSTR
jgi:hypothetical protein